MLLIRGLLVLCWMLEFGWGQNGETTKDELKELKQQRLLDEKSFTEALDKACDKVKARREKNKKQHREGKRLEEQDPAMKIFRYHNGHRITSQSMESQEIIEELTKIMINEYGITTEQVKSVLTESELKTRIAEATGKDECSRPPFNCSDTFMYRTIDGSCNNLKNPSWGMSSVCLQRLLKAYYSDGVSALRRSVSGKPLPNARHITEIFNSDTHFPDVKISILMCVWGQFVDHDITISPTTTGPNGTALVCCPLTNETNPDCDPVIVSPKDTFYSQHNVTCIANARIRACPTCTLGARQQPNFETSYLDLSQVYGYNWNLTNSIRTMKDGLMLTVMTDGGEELMPPSFRPLFDGCSSLNDKFDCFQCGDVRCNQYPALTSFHTLFIREHNRRARQLKKINPGWNDERLFFEARRIAGAEMQNVFYSEYLGQLIGKEEMKKFNLQVLDEGYTEYNPEVNGGLYNEGSVTALCFGHSIAERSFTTISSDHKEKNTTLLRNLFSNPFGLYETGEIDNIFRGMFKFPAQKNDRHVVTELTNHMFQTRRTNFGVDLMALIINRGRDHGLPPYTVMLKFCGGPSIKSFKDLNKILAPGARSAIEKLYTHVDDIDLYVGGLGELPVVGGMLGPTFSCIFSLQFYSLKYGDRFYYEHGNQSGSFTPAQLKDLRKITMTRIICANMRNLDTVPLHGFIKTNKLWNPIVKCSDLPDLNMKNWAEVDVKRMKADRPSIMK